MPELTSVRACAHMHARRLVFLLPRLASLLVSLCVDASVYTHARATAGKGAAEGALLALAASWPAATLMARPLSNSAETALVALLCALCAQPCARRVRTLVLAGATLGALVALGVAVRPTFVVFAVSPLAVRALHQVAELPARSFLAAWSAFAAAFAFTACALAVADGAYLASVAKLYHDDALAHTRVDAFVFTPLRFLAYNAAHAHEHGMHPHWLHTCINVPLLLGPTLAGLVYTNVWATLLGGKDGCRLFPLVTLPARVAAMTAAARARLVAAMCCAFSLAVLSAAPHQEPRFLLPLVVPATLLGGEALARSRGLRTAHLIFGGLGLAFFGWLHQVCAPCASTLASIRLRPDAGTDALLT